MLKLLNRIAWLVSLLLWYIVVFALIWLDTSRIWSDEIWISMIFWTFAWMFLKKMFLSKAFITNRLDYFAESLGKRLWKKSSKKEIENLLQSIPFEEKKPEQLFEAQELDILPSESIEINCLDPYFEDTTIEAKEDKKRLLKEAINKRIWKDEVEQPIIQEPDEPSKFALAVNKFFSENLLAKLGWILVFLWVLFLLSLVYAWVWAVWKIIIWFAIWFWIYFTWVWLDKKDFSNEWKVLLWIWLLINYLVILSGRYLIWDNISGDNFLSDTTTFLFLIFNTVFAVVTSLVYKSRTLLLFSFIFAFLNPFLIWGNIDSPYLIIWYSLIVSAGWLFLWLKQKDEVLTYGVFILSNLLFLSAPFHTDLHWIIKLFSSTLMTLLSVIVMYRLNKNHLIWILVWAYIYIILLLWSGEVYIWEITSYISYMLSIILIFSLWIYCFLKTGINALLYLLLFPVLILLWLNIWGSLISVPLSLVIIVFAYLLWFSFMESKMSDIVKYAFFSILWVYIFFTNTIICLESVSLDFISFISVLFVSFVFLFTTYFLSQKKGLEYLFSIWTIGWVLMLAPVIQENTDLWIMQLYFSIFAVSLFAISKWFIPFLYDDFFLRKHNIKNIVVWVVIWLIFVWYELFTFGSNYFPGVSLWFAFVWLAWLYFFIAYMIIGKLWIENVKTNKDSKNAVAVYIAASISLFTLAMALVFSEYPWIISAIWLFEATILFFVYNKIKEIKIFTAWIILFLIWLSKLGLLLDVVKVKDFVFLVPLIIIASSFVLNLRYLNFVKEWWVRTSHDLLHIVWVWIIGLLMLIIIPNTWMGWSILGVAAFISIISIIYAYYDSKNLKIFFVILLIWMAIFHIGEIEYVFSNIERKNLDYLKLLQYFSTILISGWVIMWNKINKEKSLNSIVNIIFGLYLFVITSIFIYDIFNTTFAITIYWWVVASTLFFRWISKEKASYRTIWLYLILLTSSKIFLYDIWYWIDDAISRVVALIFIWLLFIFISTRFTKKFWNNIAWEFNLTNLSWDKKERVEDDL